MPSLPPPDVLIESGAMLVVNKPGGLLTQAPPGIDSLELRTKQWLIKRDNKPGRAYLGVPHRLDRPVSGIILLCKNVRATSRISEQLQSRTIKKIYRAVVAGCPESPSGTWTDHMRKLPDEARSEIVEAQHPDSKQAVLHYETLDAANGMSLLEIQLETGRTHQIRLQCSEHGHPIVGDTLYGSTLPFGPETADQRKRWIALHSYRIEFEHPMTKEPVAMSAPMADHWQVFDSFGELLFPHST